MSYILEALRRADSERSRGKLPDIHDQPIAAVATAPAPRWQRPAAWAAVGVIGGLAVAVATRWMGAPTPAPAPPTPASTSQVTPSAAAALPPVAMAPSAAVAPPTRPAPSMPPVPVSPIASPPPATTVPAQPFLPPPAAAAPARKATDPSARAASAAASAPPVGTEVVALKDLPAALRQQFPPLRIGGSVYSKVPADRLLLVDGQVAREGDTVAPGVVLEQIRPRSAVLRFQQQRVEVGL